MAQSVSHDALRQFSAECFASLGVNDASADRMADSLVQADLWGHPSHGVMRLFWYAARIQSGATVLNEPPKVDGGLGAIATMDGKCGLGQLVALAAMSHAITLSKQHGIGAVSVRQSGHFGTAMYFTQIAAQAGCVGFISSNASPAMAPWGGTEKRVGTNPWSWAAPAGRYPTMMLDVANTAVARGKLQMAKRRGESIPDNWAIDAEGNATTDPTAGIDGIILPMAGHKGYAISTLMDVLSGVLSGSPFGTSVVGPYVPEGESGVGHFVLAVDIECTRALPDFEADVERLIEELKSVPRQPGVDEIFYPGEREAVSDRRLREAGIVLPDTTADELRSKAKSLGVTAPF